MGSTSVDSFLEHYGVKGMKWGVRRDRSKSSGSSGEGTNNKPHAHELSDEELKKHIARMELEKRYTDLSKQKHSATKGAGADFAKELGKNLVRTAVSAAGTHAVNSALKAVVKK